MGTTAQPGYTRNRRRLAWCRVSNSPGTREGHPGGPSGDIATVVAEHNFLATTWWTASPVQSRGLTPSGTELGLFAVRIRARSTPGSWHFRSPTRCSESRRPRRAVQCCPSKEPLTPKTGRRFSFDEPQPLFIYIHLTECLPRLPRHSVHIVGAG